MTIEQKDKAIKDFCSHRESCVHCPLIDAECCHTGNGYGHPSEDDINENYNILVDEGYIQSEKLKESEKLEESEKSNDNVHLKGYIYDSLMYRYMMAREKQMEYEIRYEYLNPKTARDKANRDTWRFAQILNEVIGEHD